MRHRLLRIAKDLALPHEIKPLLAGERRMVGILKAFHPKALSRVQLLTLAGLSNSGTTRNYLNRLKRCGLIEIDGDLIRRSRQIQELIG